MLSIPGIPQLKRAESHFFSKYAALLDIALRISDVVMVIAVALAVYRVEFGSFAMKTHYTSGLIRAVLLILVVFPAAGLYRSWRGEHRAFEIGRVWIALLTVMLVLLLCAWALKTTEIYSRVFGATWFFITGAMLTIDRLILRWILRSIRVNGVDSRRVLVIGGTQAGQRIVNAVRKNAWAGLDVIGYLCTPYDQVEIEGIPCLGSVDDLNHQFDGWAPDQVWVALPMRAEAIIQKVLHLTLDKPATIRLVPDFFGYELINQHATALAGVPVITLRGSRIEGHARIAKAVEDRVMAFVLLVGLAPLMMLMAFGVKLSSPGPVIYRQRRHGLGGKEIEVWKFRSMRIHSDAQVVQAQKNDPRVTRFGRFLRSSSLDELPQLINVIRGDMSIVGPRPHAIEHNRHYSDQLHGYMQRHGVKPGMTGLAQIMGFRGETDTLDKMARRVECDISYIRHWTIWLDLKIILRTPLVLLKGTNAH